MDSTLDINNIDYLLSLSEDEILDKIIELRPECSNYSFCIGNSISVFNNGFLNSAGLLSVTSTLLHNIRELCKSKRNRAKKWIYSNYEYLKGRICHNSSVRGFTQSQLLSAELVIELAKSIAQKSGEELEYATIIVVFLLKFGMQNFCKDEWNLM